MEVRCRLVSAVSVLALLSAGAAPAAYGADPESWRPAVGGRQAGAPPAPEPAAPKLRRPRIPASVSQLIVRYRSGASVEATLPRIAGSGSGVSLLAGNRIVGRVSTVRLSRRVDLATATSLSKQVQSDPRVVYAEPDLWLSTAGARLSETGVPVPSYVAASPAAPNDPLLSSEWGLVGDHGIRARSAWARTRGSGAVVAVLDSGLADHPDLSGQSTAGYDMVTDPTVSNDGDGRDADPADPGDWNDGRGSSWHGTMVTGTIAAVTDNGVGIAGVAPLAKVQMVRVLGPTGGHTSDIAAGIYWAAGVNVPGVPVNPTPATVINMSLGAFAPLGCSTAMQTAIDAAVARGVTVVVAAGNDATDAGDFTPANCANVIAVAATGPQGLAAPYSNFGPTVDLAAPGGDAEYAGGAILSTSNSGATSPASASYAWAQGTSMAAPHVTGTVALMAALAPDLTPAQVEARLKATARVLSTCSISDCGSGLVDANAALPAPPGAPIGVRVAGHNGAVGVSWAAPGSNGGSPITGYRVTASPGGRICTTTGAPTCVLRGMTNGVRYTATVRATNDVGDGPPSATSRAVVPSTSPGRPRSLRASYPRVGRTVVRWRAPASNGGALVTRYAYRISTTRGATWRRWTRTGVRTVTIAGLVRGRTYPIQVRAVNRNGPGPAARFAAKPSR